MVRVVVVDDEPMVCAHLRTILGSAPDIEVVDEAHDGAAGVEAVTRNRPDVVLMDLRMSVMRGTPGFTRFPYTTLLRSERRARPAAAVVRWLRGQRRGA